MRSCKVLHIAVDESGNRVTVENTRVGEKYYCPVCRAPVVIKALNSSSVKTHFSHKRGSKCLDDWKYDMSEWHYNWQERFPVDCREKIVQMGNDYHRADAILYNTVFEFQHSPMSFEEFTKRNQFYLNCGYEMVWVFDANKKVKNPEVMIEPPSCINDMVERRFEWKRIQDIFKEFHYPKSAKIAIYLEVDMQNYEEKVLIPLKDVDPLSPSAHYCEPLLSPKSLLKEYNLISDEKILSISEIMKNTQELRNNMHKVQMRNRF